MASSTATRRRRGASRTFLPLLILVILFGVLAWLASVVWHLISGSRSPVVVPPAQQCVATVGDASASLTPDQSHWASIIVAESIRRGLEPRAASIALATAMQESNLHNLAAGEGDRDSVGLFQQRPSQGWGTAAQISDPWYSSGKFYDALVKVHDWKTGNMNDVAQEVQHSGVPDGYAKHVADARTLASSATGYSPASMSCISRGTGPGNAAAVGTLLGRTFPKAKVSVHASSVSVSGLTTAQQWAAATLAMMNTDAYGVSSVSAAGRNWTNDPNRLAAWTSATPSDAVEVQVRNS